VATCVHLSDTAAIPDPDSTEGCFDCLREGTRWVHLRQCTTCGHVACCDSSPRRHATAHYHSSTHPVVRSFEPGESWRWCYVDQQVA
jgi:CPA1 family monovalent cation:H+ antiporter